MPKRQIIAWCPGNTVFLEPLYSNEGKLLQGADFAKTVRRIGKIPYFCQRTVPRNFFLTGNKITYSENFPL